CHRDIFPRNVFVRHIAQTDQSVAIDWAFAGPGAVGEELASLVGASLAFFEAEPAHAEKLEHHCLSGYLEGLRSAGWQGDRADVRFGYLATYVLRYAIGTLVPVLPILLDESKHHWAEQIIRRPIAAIVENTRITVAFQEQRIAEVRALLAARQARG
ncbi:MAG TPA: phosphotransferase, partial [Roseiflexaceae bacterium]|nr:phosphotransferase [Roseiflexaceae bacterium]